MSKLYLLVALVVCSTNAFGQVDNILWASTQIRKQISEDYSFQFQPIIRYNNDFGSYQNYSLDFSLRRKLDNVWHVQFLSRTWIVPDRSDRQFVWFDIGHKSLLPKLSLSMVNRLRYHHAFTIAETQDPDYFRYLLQFVPTTSWKLKPTFGLEYWWHLSDEPGVIRGRVEPGLRYQFSERYGINFIWRIQYVSADEIKGRQNLWVVALVHHLK